jgi:hypothetical protein
LRDERTPDRMPGFFNWSDEHKVCSSTTQFKEVRTIWVKR